MTETLWQPIQVGDLYLPHRLAMSPMTRNRAGAFGVPTALNAEYYAQRASMALLITEGTQPSDDGQGYMDTPGIYTGDQIRGWRLVTDAVRHAGGQMFIQLMHTGRVAQPANTIHGRQPVAPSAVKPDIEMDTPSGRQHLPEPRALATNEIADVVREFCIAACAARKAGAEGIELHGANGYLIHQFLSDNANVRTDEYGVSVENKIRFAVEVASAVAAEIGPGRVGMRISPGNPLNDIKESNVAETYLRLISELAKLGLAYLHLVHRGDEPLLAQIRQAWPGVLVVNRGGADITARTADIENGRADVITVGTMALANPDLVTRIRQGDPLNQPDKSTFYGGGAHGYADYPALERD